MFIVAKAKIHLTKITACTNHLFCFFFNSAYNADQYLLPFNAISIHISDVTPSKNNPELLQRDKACSIFFP